MQESMIQFIDSFGYWGIFLLILVENIFPPIPSEVVLLFGGALTTRTSMGVPGVIAAATAGSVLGAIALYILGKVLKKQRLKALFAGRLGRVLHFKPEYIEKAFGWFARYQNKAVLLCRCIPIVRSLISVPAGCNEMNLTVFLILTAIGSAVWNTVMVLIGAALGTAWETALPYISDYSVIALAVLVIAAAAFFGWKLYKRKKAAEKSDK